MIQECISLDTRHIRHTRWYIINPFHLQIT